MLQSPGDYRKQIADLKKQNIFHPRVADLPMDRAPKVGDAGRLVLGRLKVVQVVDADNVIGEIVWYQSAARAATLRGGTQVVDQQNESRYEVVWLTVPTQGMVDGKLHRTNQLFFVSGSRTYDTAAGTNTVLRFQAIEATEDELRGAYAEYVAEQQKRAEAKLWRTWTTADGKFKIEAKFIAFRNDRVVLEKRDGKQVGVPPARLSEADRAYYRAELKRRTRR